MNGFLPILTSFQCEIAGVFGFAAYVTNYTLLTLGVLTSNSIVYFGINLCAATLVLIGLTVSFNLASALIQCFGITLSIIAIAIRLFNNRDRVRA